MDQNKQTLAQLIGRLKAEVESQFPGAVAEWDEQISQASEARKTELAGQKAAPTDFVDTGMELAKAIATETGNQKAIDLVDALADTAEDALHGKFGALIGDLITDYKVIKAATKK